MGYVIFCLPSSNTRQYVLQKLKLLQYMLHSIKLWISWADPQAATEVWIRYIIINYVTSPNWIYVMLLSELISDSESSWWNKLGNHLTYLFLEQTFDIYMHFHKFAWYWMHIIHAFQYIKLHFNTFPLLCGTDSLSFISCNIFHEILHIQLKHFHFYY